MSKTKYILRGSREQVRAARIELAPSAWKADVLPLNYARIIYFLTSCAHYSPGSAKNIVVTLLVFREKAVVLSLYYAREIAPLWRGRFSFNRLRLSEIFLFPL